PAFLTMTTFPGATIHLNGAAEPAATSPVLRHEVKPGRYDIDVETTPGLPRVHFASAELLNTGELALVPVGPTVSFRQLRDQVSLLDRNDVRFVRKTLDPSD